MVDLAEPLRALLGHAGDHRAQLLELGPHLDSHLIEAGVDDVLLGAELGNGLLAGLLGDGAELLAAEHRRLFDRGVHGGIAFGHGLAAQFDHRQRDGIPDGLIGAGRRSHGRRG